MPFLVAPDAAEPTLSSTSTLGVSVRDPPGSQMTQAMLSALIMEHPLDELKSENLARAKALFGA
jgi:hypothetical protein